MKDQHSAPPKVALITGAAHRVGAAIVDLLHSRGMNIVLHYRNSDAAAQSTAERLNRLRSHSVMLLQADLSDIKALPGIVNQVSAKWGSLDLLINNASSFYPTPIGSVDESQWDDLFASNLKAPFFLAQAAQTLLAKNHGCIINIVDIHAERPLKNHTVYCVAKAGLVMLTKSLAREFGKNIRVNAVAPGAIMWPEDIAASVKSEIISRTALKRKGDPLDIAKAVLYLAEDAEYVTGQILTVDGGRSLNS